MKSGHNSVQGMMITWKVWGATVIQILLFLTVLAITHVEPVDIMIYQKEKTIVLLALMIPSNLIRSMTMEPEIVKTMEMKKTRIWKMIGFQHMMKSHQLCLTMVTT